METDVHFRRDSNADHNRSEHQNKKKHNKSNANNHFNCNKSSKTKDKPFDGQQFNTSKDKHQNKNKTQSHREKDNKQKKSSNSVKNNLDNNLTITTNKCNNNKKNNNKDKERDNSKDNSKDNSSTNHKINKNKDNHQLKTNKDVINNNKSLNELLDNNKSLSNRETSLDTNQKKSCLVVKEFKFFKEKAKKKNITEQKAATSKSSKVGIGTNSSNSCGTTSCKQVLKSCDVLSTSGVSDGSAKHKSKGIGLKETKHLRDGSVGSYSSTSTLSSATSSANISCDSKTVKLKTSAKTNKSTTNAKYSHSSDKTNDKNCSETKKNLSPNKTITQSSKATKNKTPIVESNDKCPKNESKRKNKVNLIRDNPLYDEDIIDGFAFLSFKSLDDIEVCLLIYNTLYDIFLIYYLLIYS